MPDVKLTSIFTHEQSNSPWAARMPDLIRPVMFGQGQSSEESWVKNLKHEWNKGKQIIELFKTDPPSLVIVNGYADPARVRVIRWCRQNGLPCFVWGDSNIRCESRQGWRSWSKSIVLRQILSQACGAMCCGTLGKAYFEYYGVPAERIFMVPYEPDYELIRSITPEQKDEAKKRFGLADHRKRIVFSGRLIPVKRPDLLIDAFLRVANQRPDWDLLMVGDGPLREVLKSRIPKDLDSRVVWTGFLDDQTTVSALYRSSDVLVLPSDYEPWALVINEAAAAGLAILASDVVGAAEELVEPGVNGYRFKAGSLEELTDCLLRVTETTQIDRLKSASEKVLQRWCERADPVAGVRQAMTFVRDLTEKRKA
jgi:glycosyltransferase involved in cell wall biosynthesis